MKQKGRQACSLCLSVFLLWSILSGIPAAAFYERSSGEISLENAYVIVKGIMKYTGKMLEPEVTVSLDGITLQKDSDYTVVYKNNVNAGEGTVIVTGCGDYTGSKVEHFDIRPYKLKDTAFKIKSCVKEFDNSKAAKPEIMVQGLEKDTLEATYTKAEYSDPYVGNQEVTVSGIQLAGEDSKNYVLENPNMELSGEGKITSCLPDMESSAELAKGHSMDLKSLLSQEWQGEAVFSIVENTSGCTLEGSVLTAGDTEGKVKIRATLKGKDIGGDNQLEYADGGNGNFADISIVEKEVQPPQPPIIDGGGDDGEESNPGGGGNTQDLEEQKGFSLIGPDSMVYGQSIRLTTSGGSGTGQVSYWVEPRGQWGRATIDSQGILTATQAGKVLVYAEKAGDDRYQPAKANPIEVTIQQAAITIKVRDKTATVGDPVPPLGSKDYTVTGLVLGDTLAVEPTMLYSPVPDLSQPGRVAIQATGAEVPEGGNYRSQITYLPGTLTIHARPTHPIIVEPGEHGVVTASCQQALEGTEVTLIVVPEEGFSLKKLTAHSPKGNLSLWESGEGKYTFIMPDEAVTVTAQFSQEEGIPDLKPDELPFLDVNQWDWFYEDVNYVHGLGLMNGTGATTFSPHKATTRGMLVTTLYRMDGSPQGAGWAPFQDVKFEDYYGRAVGWAAWHGIVNGYSTTMFGPNDSVTREQLASILYRYGKYKGWSLAATGNLYQFTDWEQSHDYAREAMSWAVGAGLLKGKDQGRLDPLGQATRAQVAAILHRFHALYLSAPAP